jgi:hypothetical protein
VVSGYQLVVDNASGRTVVLIPEGDQIWVRRGVDSDVADLPGLAVYIPPGEALRLIPFVQTGSRSSSVVALDEACREVGRVLVGQGIYEVTISAGLEVRAERSSLPPDPLGSNLEPVRSPCKIGRHGAEEL